MNENINNEIYSSLMSGDYYNGNNRFIPKINGGEFFLSKSLDTHFKKVTDGVKGAFNVSDIDDKYYKAIEKNFLSLLSSIDKIEEPNEKDLHKLAVSIIRREFAIPQTIKYYIKDTDLNKFSGVCVKDVETNNKNINSYESIDNENFNIERERFLYTIICGVSNDFLSIIFKYASEINLINPRLFGLYSRMLTFNRYKIWVTPNSELFNSIDINDNFKIYANKNEINISLETYNFISTLYEATKSMLCVCANIKLTNKYVEYDSIWNDRLGLLVWEKMQGKISFIELPKLLDELSVSSENEIRDKLSNIIF